MGKRAPTHKVQLTWALQGTQSHDKNSRQRGRVRVVCLYLHVVAAGHGRSGLGRVFAGMIAIASVQRLDVILPVALARLPQPTYLRPPPLFFFSFSFSDYPPCLLESLCGTAMRQVFLTELSRDVLLSGCMQCHAEMRPLMVRSPHPCVSCCSFDHPTRSQIHIVHHVMELLLSGYVLSLASTGVHGVEIRADREPIR